MLGTKKREYVVCSWNRSSCISFLFTIIMIGMLRVSASFSLDNNGISDRPKIRQVAIVGGTHGNEYTGVWYLKTLHLREEKRKLQENYPSLDIFTLFANPKAHLQNVRFVETDLNREFSRHKLDKTNKKVENKRVLPMESLRAREINEFLGPKSDTKTDVIIDLHSTTTNMGTTLIIDEGDAVMAQAAAYICRQCGGEENGFRCLVEHHLLRPCDLIDDDDDEVEECDPFLGGDQPFLASIATHAFTVEVGPVPQGVLRHDAIENTDRAVKSMLEFLEQYNNKIDAGEDDETGELPCYLYLGKIPWPVDEDNPNFPAAVIHKSIQDRDFHMIRKGDPLFVKLDGSIIEYDGSFGDEAHLIFINEGGYYYSSSGTGVGIAKKVVLDLSTGLYID